MSEEELLVAIRKMIKRTEEPKMIKKFEGYSKSLLMTFQDIGLEVAVRFENGIGTAELGTIKDPAMRVTTDSRTILDILRGEISAMRAFMSGKIKADGPARDLMKLQHLLKA